MSELTLPELRVVPPLDPLFMPASVWNRAYRQKVEQSGSGEPVALVLERPDGSVSVTRTQILPHQSTFRELNERYVERLLKFLLWQRGGRRIGLAGPPELAGYLQQTYAPQGARAFDSEVLGVKIYGRPLVVESLTFDQVPENKEIGRSLGRHLEGCRIGFDLGGSDRKCSAVLDGEVIHTEEVVWDPYFKTDPQWHLEEIHDSLQRAAAKLPRVDAIGGSAAGVYVDNEVRVASLFRGVPPELFETRVRGLFKELQRRWGGIPLVVVNDGEVTALAGSMALQDNAVLGIAMGTSLAAGYVTSAGQITGWLNELAFAPVDYNPAAPRDEWSGDRGVGAQYFSQQAVGRLAPAAGLALPSEMPLPERLIQVQERMAAGDERAKSIYQTIGVYFGYALAHYAELYELRNVLALGRVMSGPGGAVILERASHVLAQEFPDLAGTLRLSTPDEKQKRHGQAVAAASLPSLD